MSDAAFLDSVQCFGEFLFVGTEGDAEIAFTV